MDFDQRASNRTFRVLVLGAFFFLASCTTQNPKSRFMLAEKLWHDNPGASYADIHHHPDMTKYGNAGVYGLSTIKDWLRSVAPQDIKRGGRPKKAK